MRTVCVLCALSAQSLLACLCSLCNTGLKRIWPCSRSRCGSTPSFWPASWRSATPRTCCPRCAATCCSCSPTSSTGEPSGPQPTPSFPTAQTFASHKSRVICCGSAGQNRPLGSRFTERRRLFFDVSLCWFICSTDSKHKQESARLLGCLVHACPRLILPYIAPVLKVTAPRNMVPVELLHLQTLNSRTCVLIYR